MMVLNYLMHKLPIQPAGPVQLHLWCAPPFLGTALRSVLRHTPLPCAELTFPPAVLSPSVDREQRPRRGHQVLTATAVSLLLPTDRVKKYTVYTLCSWIHTHTYTDNSHVCTDRSHLHLRDREATPAPPTPILPIQSSAVFPRHTCISLFHSETHPPTSTPLLNTCT